MSSQRSLIDHYQQALSNAAVIAQIEEHYPAGPTPPQLAPLDQLHIGGLAASRRLLALLGDAKQRTVLDIGAGLGGLLRQGSALGFTMIGLDITHRFSLLGQALSSLPSTAINAGPFDQRVTGDAGALPFGDASFDAAIFQHSLMNMPSPDQVLGECRRVLRPNGRLIMHEVVSGPNVDALRYPVPWAERPEHSHLHTQKELADRLLAAGFVLEHCEDWTHTALKWRQRQRSKEQQPRAAILSPAWVFGERFTAMGSNLLNNLTNRAINVVEISARC